MSASPGTPAPRGSRSLRSFVTQSFAGTLVVVSLVSGILQFNAILDWGTLLLIGLAVFGVSGWLAAVYVSYSSKFVASQVEVLLAAIVATTKEKLS